MSERLESVKVSQIMRNISMQTLGFQLTLLIHKPLKLKAGNAKAIDQESADLICG